MLARLGKVIYWASCGIAVLVFIGGAALLALSSGPNSSWPIALAMFAAVVWLIGRAALFILAAK